MPVITVSGTISHYVASHRDPSEEIEMRRVEGELETLKTDMIGIVTHDLRNPVANVIGYLDLSGRDNADPVP